MNTLVINTDQGKHTISRHIYGHFSEHLGRCIYGGYWVGEDATVPHTRGIRADIVSALKKIRIPNLRWPGGCFADEYHWMDGIGPSEQRPCMINTHWGGVTENNHFGTHEFLDLCGQLGCDPYICGNVGSGTVQEMSQWVEYITFGGTSPMAGLRAKNGRKAPWPLKFFGVGNESWGCGGHMRPEFYADNYRRYATYCRNYGDNKLYKIACGPNDTNYRWTEVLMEQVPSWMMQGLALHYYTVPYSWQKRGLATHFDGDDWFETMKTALRMEDMVAKHSTIMDKFDPEKKVALVVDEWGTWWDVEPGTNPGFLYQQNTLRDALVAALTLNIFNNHCERVRMANIAQTINVLQAMILTEGTRMLVTPTYHVFEMFTVHHDATMLPVSLECAKCTSQKESVPQVSASASRDAQGAIHVSLCNLDHAKPAKLACKLHGATPGTVTGRILTAKAMNAHNTFDKPEAIMPAPFTEATMEKGALLVNLPAKSVVVLEVK